MRNIYKEADQKQREMRERYMEQMNITYTVQIKKKKKHLQMIFMAAGCDILFE